MSVTLKYLKSRPVAKATFRLPAEAAPKAKKVHLVGDFNDWNEKATPMERLKDGTFKVVLDLDAGQAYSFRYLMTVGLHGAYMARGDFFTGNPQVAKDPWAAFTTFTWYAF